MAFSLTFPGSPSSSSFLGVCPDLGLGSAFVDFSSPPAWVKLNATTRPDITHVEIFRKKEHSEEQL